MTLIKLLLLAAIAVIGLLAFRGGRRPIHKVIGRGLVLVVLTAAALSVMFPDTLSRVANAVGVGRGADLVLYVLSLTFLLITVILFRRIADLERKITQLARAHAVSSTIAQQQSHEGERG